MSIPKILHFTWKTKTLTRLAQRVWKDWENSHPGWEMRLWDDADIRNLVAEHYPEHLATFDGYPSGIFRADAFRFFVLHKFGGVYSDLDVLPLGDVGQLLDRTDCFVGAEPEKHVRENDALYRGMPFSLCNAFMGSVPGHIFWQRCMEAMARCSVRDVVDATGPRFINGIALTIAPDERPDVLPPSYWSPLAGDGRKWPTPEAYNEVIARHFRLVGRGEPAVVSHLWRNSWFMPIPYKGPSFWKIPNHLQWALRRRSSGEMGKTVFAAPSVDYDRQDFEPPAALPRLYLAVDWNSGDGEGYAGVLAGLDYPIENVTIGIFASGEAAELSGRLAALGFSVEVHREDAGGAVRHNAMLEAGRDHDAVILADGSLTAIAPDALRKMVATPRSVVGLNVHGADGGDRNESSFLYHQDAFKRLYRAVREHGHVPPLATRGNFALGYFRYLNIAPLTSVGADFLLVRRDVVEAGVRFAEQPYKYHLDAEAFSIAARDRGFEVCALPNVIAVTSRTERNA